MACRDLVRSSWTKQTIWLGKQKFVIGVATQLRDHGIHLCEALTWSKQRALRGQVNYLKCALMPPSTSRYLRIKVRISRPVTDAKRATRERPQHTDTDSSDRT